MGVCSTIRCWPEVHGSKGSADSTCLVDTAVAGGKQSVMFHRGGFDAQDFFTVVDGRE